MRSHIESFLISRQLAGNGTTYRYSLSRIFFDFGLHWPHHLGHGSAAA